MVAGAMEEQKKQIYQLRMMLLGTAPEPALTNFKSCAGVELEHKSKGDLSHMVVVATKRLADGYKSNQLKTETITKLRSEVSSLKLKASK